MPPRVIVVPQAAAMDACDLFVLLISCSALRPYVSLARGTVLQRNFESPIYDSLRIGVAAYSEDKAHPADEMTDQGIRSGFRSNTLFDVQLYNEYLDGSRFTDRANARALADYLRRKYARIKIDTIITIYPAAVDFLLSEAIDVFPDTPLVANEVSR